VVFPPDQDAALPLVRRSHLSQIQVTLARGFTTTFAGIAINDVPGFIFAQIVGAAIGALASVALFPAPRQSSAGVMALGE